METITKQKKNNGRDELEEKKNEKKKMCYLGTFSLKKQPFSPPKASFFKQNFAKTGAYP